MFRDDYFNKRRELLNKNHVYRNHIKKFIDYLCLPEVKLSDMPTRINKDVVEACIKYYHDKGELNSRSTMESHLESVKSFYDYLSESGKASDIFSDYSYSKFKDDIVEKYSLLEPVERGIYNCEDIKTILINLDKSIDNFQGESAGIREEERHLQRIMHRSITQMQNSDGTDMTHVLQSLFMMMRANWPGTMSLSQGYWCAMQKTENCICMIF